MAVNRQVVKKSRILRRLVKHGMDKRQMVRQLCRLGGAGYDKPILKAEGIGGCVIWSETPQGHNYWYGIAKRIGEYD